MKLEMCGSGDVVRGKNDNTGVEVIRGNFARKRVTTITPEYSTPMTPMAVSDFGKQ
jgi:hypothetical protein